MTTQESMSILVNKRGSLGLPARKKRLLLHLQMCNCRMCRNRGGEGSSGRGGGSMWATWAWLMDQNQCHSEEVAGDRGHAAQVVVFLILLVKGIGQEQMHVTINQVTILGCRAGMLQTWLWLLELWHLVWERLTARADRIHMTKRNTSTCQQPCY